MQPLLIRKSSLMQGFVISDYADKHSAGIKQLTQWLQEDKLHYSETIREGFESIPKAFLDLFEGKNKEKMVIKL